MACMCVCVCVACTCVCVCVCVCVSRVLSRMNFSFGEGASVYTCHARHGHGFDVSIVSK